MESFSSEVRVLISISFLLLFILDTRNEPFLPWNPNNYTTSGPQGMLKQGTGKVELGA
jgi:hypothetical protein